jgi:cytochrome c553
MSAQDPGKIGGTAILTVAAIALAAFLMGFYVLPSQDRSATVWQRICSAAGFARSPAGELRKVAPPAFTSVVVPNAVFGLGTPEQIGRGATLALRCTVCHGARGLSGADAPNLAGQYSDVIYKQLIDFKRGARADAVMTAMSASLTEEDILELAHYYAYLPRERDHLATASAPALVRVGDPMRNIAPCASCHGSDDRKKGAPSLNGEPQSYLRKQLSGFASGSRKNDANAAMRNVARRLSPMEMDIVTNHYAGISP